VRICSGAGCLRAVPDDVRFCWECSSDKQTPQKRSGWQRGEDDPLLKQYSTPRWNKQIRPRVLLKYPTCIDCKRNASQVADHNIPARRIVAVCRAERLFPFDSYGGFYIMANLVGRCHGCHNKKTKTEDARDWTDELDKVLAPYRADRAKRLAGGG
jgi:5-methylcytosine-specific restriction endonuclease McrA